MLVNGPGRELALADTFDVRRRQKRLAHVTAIAGGVALQIVFQRNARQRFLGRRGLRQQRESKEE